MSISLEKVRRLRKDGKLMLNIVQVSQNLWKRMNGKNQKIHRSKLLLIATTHNNIGLVTAISPYADPQSLNKSLTVALEKKNLTTTEVLLSCGADATSNTCQLALKGFVREGNHDMISLLLRAPTRPPDKCVTESLALAIQQGSLETVMLLVKSGADCRYGDASALKDAVRLRRDDLAVAMLAGSKHQQLPSSAVLDQMVAVTSTKQFLLRKALLCAGAKGPGVDTLLRNSVEQLPPRRDNQLISMLVRYGANVNFDHGKCVKSAVSRGEVDILRLLLPGNPSIETASQSMTLAMEIENRPQQTEIIQLLIEAGASDHVLFHALEHFPGNINIMRTLLVAGFSPDEQKQYVIDDKCGEESVTVLCWVLCQREQQIYSSIIDILIEIKGIPLKIV